MKKKILAGLTIGLFMFVMVGMAQASTFQVSFVASNFSPPGAPVPPVAGSIWYVAANAPGPIEAITQVDLSIAGHIYALNELTFVGVEGLSQAIGGIEGGGAFMIPVLADKLRPDFMLMWSWDMSHAEFGFTIQGGGEIWWTDVSEQFSIVGEVSAVPIPGAVYLFGSGLIGLAGFRRKFKKQ
jgi:hypothetical protein